ncbi:MAG: LysR family transcriptional regulator [Burkholderiaceae bacterium]
MNLRHVRAFVAVAEIGSIRGAARLLGVTQPAVTKAIQQIESSLGVQLVMRNVTGVTLTSYGLSFLARARLIAAELGRARDELTQLARSFEGTVTISLAPTVAELVAPKVVASFQARYPNVMVRISGGLPSSTITRVCDGTLDFVVGPRPVDGVPPVIDSWHLHDMAVAITVRRRHPLARATTLADFADTFWVLNRSASSPDGPLASAFTSLGLGAPRFRLQSDSIVAAQAIVAATDYAALMPRRAVEHGAMKQKLTIVDVPELQITNSVELFFRRDSPLTPVALELANGFLAAGRGSM